MTPLPSASRCPPCPSCSAGTPGELAANVGQRNAVEVFGLQKVFPHNPCGPLGGICCCFSGGEKSPKAFWALKGSWLTIEENQLFCLLGPNGAGKSTTINCLTGGFVCTLWWERCSGILSCSQTL